MGKIMEIRDKKTMLEVQQRGGLGNFLRTSPEIEGQGWYTIRSMERDSPYFVPVMRGYELNATLQALCARGANRDALYVQDIPYPNTDRLIQGELLDGDQGRFYLYYTVGGNLNLRDDLRERGQHVEGLKAEILLETLLTPTEWYNLMELMEKFPGHVTEFTLFSKPCGALNSRLVIWETRLY